ncbi:MAG: ATP-binding protein [Myxococcota bacterium]
MKLLSRFEARIILAILLPTIGPIVASVIFIPQLIEARFAEQSNLAVRRELEQHVLLYGAFFEAKKDVFAAEARSIGRDPELIGAARSAAAELLRSRLLQVLESHPEIGSASVFAADGKPLTRLEGDVALGARPKTIVVPLGLGRAPRLELVFGLDGGYFDARGRAEEVALLYDASLETFSQRFSEKSRTYYAILAFVALAALLLGYLIARSVTRRVQQLALGTERAAQGELDFVVPVEGADEITGLARRFNRMLRAVRDAQRRIIDLEKISSWQDFARRLAHEIKNPLTPIRLSVQELRRRSQPSDPSQKQLIEDVSDVIEDETERLTRLVNEFSQFARLPDGAPEPTDMSRLVQDFLRAYNGFEDRVELVDDERTQARVDRDQMVQVLHNLVINGLQASPDSERIRLSLRARGAWVELAVEDRGPGIDQSDVHKIFEPYFTTKTQGTGLGLAIAKKIILQHEGSIHVEAGSKGGARFVVRLPAV